MLRPKQAQFRQFAAIDERFLVKFTSKEKVITSVYPCRMSPALASTTRERR